ncbi:MAG: shikimate dehydrogenase [Epsilonproteobacteria bacterium]|nr:shikimate dehydrogenase [Campylobacterota bacterium]NPA64508.1 shikimate dehydrogenase [Campylobacterota bacterium]
MKLYAILGDPVAHSISPIMHNHAFKKLGFDGCYTRYRLQEGSMLKERFKDLALKGANITVPHKEWAYKEADEVLGIAQQIEAVNTWIEKDGKILGYNTDAPGFFESVKEFEFETLLILGAGGTAKAIALYLRAKGYDPLILNRTKERLRFFQELGFKTYTWDDFEPRALDLIVNTTSAGLEDQSLPAPKELLVPLFQKAKYAVDVIYNKITPFLALARSMGLQTKDGTDMLLYQGVLAFEIFTDFHYDKKSIEEAMRKGLELLDR